MPINEFNVSYPDFQLQQVINPDQFDQNNKDIVDKVNEVITSLNQLFGSSDGANLVQASAISGLSGSTVQALLNSLKLFVDAHINNKNNPHAVTPAQLNVYTKQEIDPYLRGGDTIIREETFTIKSSNNNDGTFTYTNSGNVDIIGNLDANGGQIFTFVTGKYELGSNRVDAIVNDTLHRSVSSGGLLEIDDSHVCLTSPEGNGSEITFRYFERIGITGSGLTVISPNRPSSSMVWFKVV